MHFPENKSYIAQKIMIKKTTGKQRKNLLTGKEGNTFTSENQPSPEAKSKGWEKWRAEKNLTQKIIEKIASGKNLDEFVESLIENAKNGNAKAIDVLISGIEEQITKTDITSGGEKFQAPILNILPPSV